MDGKGLPSIHIHRAQEGIAHPVNKVWHRQRGVVLGRK